MQVDKAGVAGRLRIAVGHADDGSLLQAEHVVDVIGPVVEERQFGRAGIAEHFLDAEGAEQAERRVLDGDRGAAVLAGLRDDIVWLPRLNCSASVVPGWCVSTQTRNLEIAGSMLRIAPE